MDREIVLEFDPTYRKRYNELVKGEKYPLGATMTAIQFCNNPQLKGVKLNSIKYEALLSVVEATKDKVVIWTEFIAAVDSIVEFLRLHKIGAVGFRDNDESDEVRVIFEKAKTQCVVATIAKGIGVN